MIEGIVRKAHSKNYTEDGKEKIEIWFRERFENQFPDKCNHPNPITVTIDGAKYAMFFRKTQFNRYLWLSPIVFQDGVRIRMTDVMANHGYSKDDRIFFEPLGKDAYKVVKNSKRR